MRFRPALLVALPIVAACGARAPEVPRGPESAEARALLEKPVDFAFVVRLDKLRADPVYGPLVDDLTDRDTRGVLAKATILDGMGTFDGDKPAHVSAVLTLRGAPALTEGELPSGLRRARGDWFDKDGGALPSGVLETVSLTSDGWPIGLYVMPGAYTLLTGRAAGHGHAHFSTHRAPPPPVDFGDDVLVAFWVGGEAAKAPAFAASLQKKGERGIVSAEVRLLTSSHGELLGKSLYDTEEHAEEAVAAARDKLGMYASVWARLVEKCPGLEVLTVANERHGRVVSSRVGRVPEGLRALKRCK